MSYKYLLSICIPTYNREKELERLLNSITQQSGFTDEVEIVISDGPSRDGTLEMIKNYQKKYKNISYYRNSVNVGMTPALLEVIAHSQGEYSWMFGSDDQMNTHALEYVVAVIKKERPKLILPTLFHYHKDAELKKTIQNNDFTIFNGFEELAAYMGSDKYEKRTLGLEQHFTFMSVFCFETSFFRNGLSIINQEKGPKYLLGNYFNYIYVVYANLEKGKIVLFEDNLVLLKYSNKSARGVKWKIYTDLRDLLYMIKQKYALTKGFLKFLRRIKFFFITLTLGALANRLGLNKNKLYIFIRGCLTKLRI